MITVHAFQTLELICAGIHHRDLVAHLLQNPYDIGPGAAAAYNKDIQENTSFIA